ncbi:MAG: tetratricopeptide repeat protein [Candidatus Krumholzibacteriota bacterium]|nr:tetratricopeptide repeat protein [Candidatus Krumholzibacteriota bacterium]
MAAKTIRFTANVFLAVTFFASSVCMAGQAGSAESENASAREIERLSEETTAYYDEGMYGKALASASQAFSLSEELYGRRHIVTAQSLNNLGQVHAALGNSAEAERMLVESIDITEDLRGRDNPEISPALKNLAVLYTASSRFSEAERAYRRLIKIVERSDDNEDAAMPGLLESLSNVLAATERFEEAIELRERALGIREKAGAAKNLYKPGDKGLAAARESLAVLRDNHAAFLNNRAISLIRENRFDEAEDDLKKALIVREKYHGPDDQRTLSTMKNLSILYTRQEKYSEAEPLCARLLKVSEDSLGAGNAALAPEYLKMVRLFQKLGRSTDAAAMYERVIRSMENDRQVNAGALVRQINNLAALYVGMEKPDKAAPLYSKAVSLITGGGIAEEPESAVILNNALQFFRETGDEEQTARIEKLLGIEPGPEVKNKNTDDNTGTN